MVRPSCLVDSKCLFRRNLRLKPVTAPPQPSNGRAPPHRSQPVLDTETPLMHPLLRSSWGNTPISKVQWVCFVTFRGSDTQQTFHSSGDHQPALSKPSLKTGCHLCRIRCSERRRGGSMCLAESAGVPHWIPRLSRIQCKDSQLWDLWILDLT